VVTARGSHAMVAAIGGRQVAAAGHQTPNRRGGHPFAAGRRMEGMRSRAVRVSKRESAPSGDEFAVPPS
jgi:hypothetical protein